EKQAKKMVRESKAAAWKAYLEPIQRERKEVQEHLAALLAETASKQAIQPLLDELGTSTEPIRKDLIVAAKHALREVRQENLASKKALIDWLTQARVANHDRYSSTLYSESSDAALNAKAIPAAYGETSQKVDGRELLRDNFDALLSQHPEVVIFGEDSGKIGGVNQGLEGMQAKHGEWRVFDTGIREATIIGQGIGMAMRGLRPIAEIQYLDYLLYALQIISDDLATVQYRTKGGQKAPLIIRTRGHRLEGIWHSGSPMGTIINSLRGVYVCVPRNMTQAAGFYNTLLASDDTGLVIESLNGYRLKEELPQNLGEYRVPLGVPEVVREGEDVTLVTYGSMVRMAEAVAIELAAVGISVEIVDVQTLLPFDLHHHIVESVKKTNRVLFVDEDVPGGATAYMMQKVLEEQGGYFHLDSEPRTLTSKDHRPAYGSDGDYFSKPSNEDIFDAVYELMHEAEPNRFPRIY
ncbi:MAG: transketolase C-terminal domain-containing protein, partial [Bacteroidota bacterium]